MKLGIRRWRLLLLVSAAFAFASVIPALAHANLARSVPAANEAMQRSPDEIRLWFTEPLEPAFSRFTLLDSDGDPVETPPSQIDPADNQQMFMQPGSLPHGLYTVVWRVVSAADGHPTEGSFAFGVGVSVVSGSTDALDERVAPEGVAIRWFNLISLALAVGSVGFWLFVWQPAMNDDSAARFRRRWYALAWIGWLLVGVAALLLLMLQVSTGAGTTLFAALTTPVLGDVLTNTDFGWLWLARVGLWVLYGAALRSSQREQRALWVVLILGALILVTQSLFSHASAAPDRSAAMANDWLHLAGMVLWVGGLIAFGLALFALRREPSPTALSARLVAAFSNYARVAVTLLIITGLYAAWLEVGSVKALLNTLYGQALVIKCVLILPLLVLAGVNLVLTQRRLNRDESLWFGRLRGLVGAEIALTVGVLLAVAVMTSGNPARGVQARLEAAANTPQAQPYFGMEIVDNQMLHLQIVPGTVGENTFIVTPFDEDGDVIQDASLIRLRFSNLDQNLGDSELRPTLDESGEYMATGANLSTPGRWRIRMTLARPGKFDTIADFEAEIDAPPVPPAPNDTIPLGERSIAALLAGVSLFAVGGFFIAQARRLTSGAGLLALGSLIVGGVFLVTAGTSFVPGGAISIREAWARPMGQGMTGGVYLTITNEAGVPERLVAADSPAAESVALHQTTIRDGIARMRPVDALDIAPGESIDFSAQGYHLMLTNLRDDLDRGETFFVTFTFASGKQITVDVSVRDDNP